MGLVGWDESDLSVFAHAVVVWRAVCCVLCGVVDAVALDVQSDEHATLGTLIAHKAMQHQAAIKAIAIRASNEAILQQMLNKVEATWEDLKLPVNLHNKSTKDVGQNKDTYVLGNLDDVITALDESNVTINTISGSRFVDALKKEVADWSAKLKLFVCVALIPLLCSALLFFVPALRP